MPVEFLGTDEFNHSVRSSAGCSYCIQQCRYCWLAHTGTKEGPLPYSEIDTRAVLIFFGQNGLYVLLRTWSTFLCVLLLILLRLTPGDWLAVFVLGTIWVEFCFAGEWAGCGKSSSFCFLTFDVGG